MTLGRLSLVGAFVLVAAAWAFVLVEQADRVAGLAATQIWHEARGFLAQLAGAGDAEPAFLDPARWHAALTLTYQTLLMSVLAIGIAGVGALATVLPAARNVADGSLSLSRGLLGWALYGLVRALYVFTRAVPELVWALLVVFVLAPGILPGAIALGLHNLGVLGKLAAEVIEDLDARPARALRAAGAGGLQTLLYAVLPQVLPQFLTYLLYRWEVVIRTTIVVGFVSAGGLGREFRLAMSWFHYTDVTLLLLCYVALVLAVDLVAGGLRRLAR